MSNFPCRDAAEHKMANLDWLNRQQHRVDQPHAPLGASGTVAATDSFVSGEGESKTFSPLSNLAEVFDAVPKLCVWEDHTLDDARQDWERDQVEKE